MTPSHPSLPVPDDLLGPLVEIAADVLRSLETADVPAQLRPVHGFDRRGLLAGPGRRQLLRAFATDDRFRSLVAVRFCELEEVQATLAAWSVADADARIADAEARHDLPLLAATLFVAEPDGGAFGLGLVAAHAAAQRRERAAANAEHDDARARATMEETQRRSELARLEAETEVVRLTGELQKERGERRTREAATETELLAAQREIDQLNEKLRMAMDAIEIEQLRTTRETKRAHALEQDLRRVRAELDLARDRVAMSKAALDARELSDAAAEAERVAGRLRELERKMRAPAPTRPAEPRPRAPQQRARPDVAKGMHVESRAGLEAMLRTPDVLLAIDGYNVTKRAWSDATPADQRERLGIAITALHGRLGCNVMVVFDGDGSGAFVAPVRRPGVRVLFSDASEEADEMIVREVASLPKRVPIVVASSDAWVREHAEAEGAVVVGADVLLAALRPDR